ncbi:Unknown protein sequence [Pseudomonas coronafaciens pv. oryzae]|nr:Unknown protein sequence [Pseudomonas coronafaciens pv. oryzae]
MTRILTDVRKRISGLKVTGDRTRKGTGKQAVHRYRDIFYRQMAA